MPVSKTRKKKGQTAQTTTPKKDHHAESPQWYVYTMLALMVVGCLVIVSAYLFSLGNITLIIGLILLAAGFLMTMNWY